MTIHTTALKFEIGNAQNAGTLVLPQASGNVIILVHVFIMLMYFVFFLNLCISILCHLIFHYTCSVQ